MDFSVGEQSAEDADVFAGPVGVSRHRGVGPGRPLGTQQPPQRQGQNRSDLHAVG